MKIYLQMAASHICCMPSEIFMTPTSLLCSFKRFYLSKILIPLCASSYLRPQVTCPEYINTPHVSTWLGLLGYFTRCSWALPISCLSGPSGQVQISSIHHEVPRGPRFYQLTTPTPKLLPENQRPTLSIWCKVSRCPRSLPSTRILRDNHKTTLSGSSFLILIVLGPLNLIFFNKQCWDIFPASTTMS